MLCLHLPPSHARHQKHPKDFCWMTLTEPREYKTLARENYTIYINKPTRRTRQDQCLLSQNRQGHLHYLPPRTTFPQNQEVTMHQGVQRTPGTHPGLYITILHQNEWKQDLSWGSTIRLIVEMVQSFAGCDYRVRGHRTQAYSQRVEDIERRL